MTTIEWTDDTWNPVTGCTKVSQGCKHCYAERVFPRVYAPRKFTDVHTHPDRLDAPLRWKKPRRVFVNSMSDLFHEDVPDEFVFKVLFTCDAAPQHTFQVLTKRPTRMHKLLRDMEPIPNVWLGVSVEDQSTADERIPILLQTPAAVKFVSAEPLLSDIRLGSSLCLSPSQAFIDGRVTADMPAWTRLGSTALDWVIVGGESGPKARPCDVAWIRSVVEECKAAGVPVFVKQLGTKPYSARARDFRGYEVIAEDETGHCYYKLRDRKGGVPSEWPTDLRVRQWPTS